MRRIFKYILICLSAIVAGVFVMNTNLLAAKVDARPNLMAHRGMAQRFSRVGLTNETCTAAQSLPTEHEFLENTIASMKAAIAVGADVIELDIHPTTDGAFAVFHDWTVDCRTEGRGVTRELSMVELRTLDIGFGYTRDGGKTFPFRGKGVGLMPTLREVLAALPGQKILINIKSNDLEEAELLADFVGGLSLIERGRIWVYGANGVVARFKDLQPDVLAFSRRTLKTCLTKYLAIGWTGIVPAVCEKTIVMIPKNYAPFMWGWPNRFVDRMARAHTPVFVVAPYGKKGPSSGIDSWEMFEDLPKGYRGGIMTNEIALLGELVK